jgi:molybdate transport system ATP-binding protein
MLELSVEHQFENFRLNAEFSAPSGQVTALFGRSGSGKTSLINIVAGLLRPDRGRVALDGQVLFDTAMGVYLPPEKRCIGYVFQDARLFPHLTVRSNLTYGMKKAARENPTRRLSTFDDVVALLDLDGLLDRKPGRLSGGEASRVGIGRALLASPKLLLLDEPLASLDAERKGEILPYLERLRSEVRLPMIYVSHAFEEVVRLATRLVVLDKGRVMAQGPVRDIAPSLDLAAASGIDEAGAVVEATLIRHDEPFGLSEIECAGVRLLVPRLGRPPGSDLKLHIRARDVSLALERPQAISILNVLKARIVEIGPSPGSAGGHAVGVVLDAGFPLAARVSQKSAQELKLTPGMSVYALIKSLSFDHALPKDGQDAGGADAA